MNKKILIVSGTPFRNDTNTGKTFVQLFKDFSKEELYQLYFSVQIPSVDFCKSYYQINEFQLLKSFLGVFSHLAGREVKPIFSEQSTLPKKVPDKLLVQKEKLLSKIIRESIWTFSYYRNKQLKKWLDMVSPDLIFTILPDTKKTARIVSWIAQRFDCPVTVFVTDDYYHDPMQSRHLLRRAYYRSLQKSIDYMVTYATRIVGCSDVAAKEFGEKYYLPYETFLTPAKSEYCALPINPQLQVQPIIFRYFGNLALGRWEVLRELGFIIAKINESIQHVLLEVYSPVTDEQIINELNIENGCVFKGFVTGETYMKLLAESNVVVHVESFSPDMIRRTRLSISTKIADYLGAGKCILAIGDSELASIAHIKDVAYTVNCLSELEKAVNTLIDDAGLRVSLQNQARKLAYEKHSSVKIAKRVRETLEQE
jgi:glycosyltransferase involved in cell wall biosynthesis